MKRLLVVLVFFLIASHLSSTVTSSKAVSKGPASEKIPEVKKKLKVVTTLSVLRALAEEVGGDLIEVKSLSQASEDPHSVKAKPTFMRLLREADLFIQIGRSLELWVPQVLASAANSKLTGSSLIVASNGVKALEVPSELTRAQGDIHPQGNPHVWLSPLAALKMAENIKAVLVEKDAANKAAYEKNFATFKAKLADALFGKELVKAMGSLDMLFRLHEGKKLAEYVASRKKNLGGLVKMASQIDYSFITYHAVESYLADEFSLKVFAQIEEKPGVPPSLKYQNELVRRAKANNVKRIVAASYYVGSGKLMELIANQIDGKKMFIDMDCRENESYIAMIERIINALVEFKPEVVKVTPKKT